MKLIKIKGFGIDFNDEWRLFLFTVFDVNNNVKKSGFIGTFIVMNFGMEECRFMC